MVEAGPLPPEMYLFKTTTRCFCVQSQPRAFLHHVGSLIQMLRSLKNSSFVEVVALDPDARKEEGHEHRRFTRSEERTSSGLLQSKILMMASKSCLDRECNHEACISPTFDPVVVHIT